MRKLTKEQVPDLVAAVADGRPIKDVAADFGVSVELAGKIVRGQAWRGVDVDPVIVARAQELLKAANPTKGKRLTDAEIDQILARISAGESTMAVARHYDVSTNCIYRLVSLRRAANGQAAMAAQVLTERRRSIKKTDVSQSEEVEEGNDVTGDHDLVDRVVVPEMNWRPAA